MHLGLLVTNGLNYWPMHKGRSRPPPGKGQVDCNLMEGQDITIKRLQSQLAKMAQILVENKLIKPVQVAKCGLSEGSKGDNKSMALSKRRVSSGRAHSSVDFHEIINAKQNCLSKVSSLYSQVRTKEVNPEVPNSILPDQRRNGPPEKFTPPKFTLYDCKSNLRSHVSHVKQMMTL
ncbi:hypothetical protein Acr_27g0000580 [Actinidia rufa]|uniref:Uncharacterized protein n=1 Tax=Actinidia rufa TaxID=165716 RepID=A0A7J0H5I8_9ERIC|nr:hypothetical protein Acr_27g0000580 [Actinidia rufa]